MQFLTNIVVASHNYEEDNSNAGRNILHSSIYA